MYPSAVHTVLRAISRFWFVIVGDLDLYALVITGIVFALLGVWGLADVKDLSSVTLAGLTLLAFSQVRSRRLVAARGEGHVVFLDEFPAELNDRRASEAGSYIFVGKTGFRTVSTGRTDFLAMMRRGATLRFLLLDPDDPDCLRMAVGARTTGADAARLESRIRGSIAELRIIGAQYPGLLEVRVSANLMTFGANGFSLGERKGVLYVQHFVRRQGREQGPMYELRTDSDWYGAFIHEIETLWSASRIVT